MSYKAIKTANTLFKDIKE